MRYLALLLVGLAVTFSAAAQPCHDAAERAAPEPVVTSGSPAHDKTHRAPSDVPPSAAPMSAHRCDAIAEACCTCCIAGSTPFAPTAPHSASLATATLVPVVPLALPSATHRSADAPVRGPPAPEVSSGHGPRGPPPTA